ncbi:hypothetical protein P4C99_21490 [Pontiellaceae bacterium B1224]|nr:hypothetical protein [Pontiellaceae bacterium B1224]
MKYTHIAFLVILSLSGCSRTAEKLNQNELHKNIIAQAQTDYDYPDPYFTVDDIVSMQIIHIDSYENYTIYNKFTPSEDDTRYPVTNKIHVAQINEILQESLSTMQKESLPGIDPWTVMIIEIWLEDEINPLGFGLSKKVEGLPLMASVWNDRGFFAVGRWQDLFDILSKIGLPIEDFEVPESGDGPRRFR